MRRLAPHVFVVALLLAGLLTGAHDTLRNLIVDSRFAALSREATGEVVLVAIDSPSLERMAVWPWPRSTHADLLTKLRQAGASEIAFDVDFSSPSDEASDHLFAEALREAGGSVVLPTFKQYSGQQGQTFYNSPLPSFAEHSWSASVNVVADADGLVRRYPFGDEVRGTLVPSLAALLGGLPELRPGAFTIDFGISARSIPMLSFVDVLQRDPAELSRIVSNKKVIVGATALELGDRVNVPNGRIIPGAMLQALATESILQGRTLRTLPVLVALAAALGLVLVIAVSWSRLGLWSRVAMILSVAATAEAGAWLLQWSAPVILDTSLLHLAAAGYLCACAAHEINLRGWLGRIAERRFQRVAMSVGDGLACTDQSGSVIFWNPAAAAMFGYTSAEMAGTPLNRVAARTNGPDRVLALSPEVLKASPGNILELEGRRRDGQLFPIEAHLFGWEGKQGIEYGILLRDISVRKREVERIRHLASTDTLTGLPNRHTLREHLDAALMEAELERHEVAVFVIDLDRFRDINDTLGHTFGDDLLCLVAQRLQPWSGANSFLARLGGDEFAIVVSSSDAASTAGALAEDICASFREKDFALRGRHMRIGCSIGISIYPRDTTSPEQLMSSADLALNRAKAARDGRWSFYTEEIKAALANKLALESEFARAIERNEFELFYQPQIRLRDLRLIGAEALIRWRHPKRGLIGPAEFMDIVHTSASSNDIAYWVLHTACSKGAAWERQGRNLRVGVNLSPSQLESDDLVGAVAEALKESGLSPHLLDLEVTENILLSDDERAAEIFARLRSLGVGLSFDDFGTGFGSLSYLKKYPFDRLKIDRSFVREIRNNAGDAAIVSSTIGLAKQLGLDVVAEGVEDAATMDVLVGMGCNEAQGYYFGRPVSSVEFEQFWWPQSVRAKEPHAA